mmetsp:Transcript_31448/g.50443  ORF Transcript_31448/g.50443 Transcript_31448/m.50443 type:complete len:210 (-) Transcript_31448:69-698(-)
MGVESLPEEVVTPRKQESALQLEESPEKLRKPERRKRDNVCDKKLANARDNEQADASFQCWHPLAIGANAQIDVTRRYAQRTRSFNQGIVFCSTPAGNCKLRVLHVDDCWDGSLQLGFALKSPDELAFKEQTLFMEFMENMAVTSISESWHRHLEIGSVVEWTLKENGTVAVEVDGRSWTSPRLLPRNLPLVYPCVGIYGNVTTVELLA